MTTPTTRAEFKEFCLRALGKPVLEINVDDDQVDDRIDESIRYYWDYHFDGSEKVYYKYQLATKDFPGHISDVVITAAGVGYANGEALIFTANGSGSGAYGTVTTNNSGSITSVTITNTGSTKYNIPPVVSVNTAVGVGATFNAYNGGYITLPENIIGAVRIFSPGQPLTSSDDMFSIRYQIALNDLYTLTNYSMVPYVMMMQQLSLINEILIGEKPIRYNRHRNRMHLDMNWDMVAVGDYMVVEAYQSVEPTIYTDMWADRWLQQYTTARIKKQWGTNMKKFDGMQLPGGIKFSGQQIFDEAVAEIKEMEYDIVHSYSLPVSDLVG